MNAPWTPMRWPAGWKDPSCVELLKGTAIDYVIVDGAAEFDAVRARCRGAGLRVAAHGETPSGVRIVAGEWPGVRMARGGNDPGGGPTGVPWVDSNGWKILLSGALHSDAAVWVDAAPPKQPFRLRPQSYWIATADCGAYGGRWILTLEDTLAAALASRNEQAVGNWNRIMAAPRFFAAHKDWAAMPEAAIAGVVSDFAGPNEFFSQELLNLLARAGVHFRIVPKNSAGNDSMHGLRAVIYADTDAPSGEWRKRIEAFVEGGGMLITVPKWGSVAGSPATGEGYPGYTLHSIGKGTVAQAKAAPDDPYTMANDAALLISHRYDLVRFWNGGATASNYTVTADGRRAVVHLLFYADRGPDAASVRIAGKYRTVKASTIDVPAVPKVGVEIQRDAVEVHLPQVSQYVALELEG